MRDRAKHVTALLAALPAFAFPVAARVVQDVSVDFAKLATGFAEAQGLDPESAGTVLFKDVLNGPGFVRVELGAFDVRYPGSFLADGDHAKAFEEAAATLLDVQEHWLAWFAAERDGHDQAQADLETLRRWVKSWSPAGLKKAGLQGGDLVQLLKSKDKEREAVERLRAFAGPNDDQRFELGDDVGRIVFAPTRKAFLEILGFLGWIDQDRRDSYWKDDNVGITASWYDWTAIVPLEAAAWPVELDKPFKAQSHNERHKTGLRQFVADRGASSLLRAAFYRAEFSMFESSIRENLVIAAVGRNDLYLADWGLSYGSSGSSSQGSSRWVPATGVPGKSGSAAGAPPPSVSVSASHVPRWRKSAGEDHFVGPLKRGQDDGASLAAKKKVEQWKDQRAHFELDSSESNKKGLVTAPFLGYAAQRKDPVAKALRDDYQEFFRAYRTAFYHWLQRHGKDDPEAAQEAFTKLMHEHADPFEDVVFEDMVQRVYGVPLSAEDGSTDSLEWRFLAWLSKQRG